jgi:hypothetical protein
MDVRQRRVGSAPGPAFPGSPPRVPAGSKPSKRRQPDDVELGLRGFWAPVLAVYLVLVSARWGGIDHSAERAEPAARTCSIPSHAARVLGTCGWRPRGLSLSPGRGRPPRPPPRLQFLATRHSFHAVPAPLPVDAPAHLFSEGRAMATTRHLAETIGHRQASAQRPAPAQRPPLPPPPTEDASVQPAAPAPAQRAQRHPQPHAPPALTRQCTLQAQVGTPGEVEAGLYLAQQAQRLADWAESERPDLEVEVAVEQVRLAGCPGCGPRPLPICRTAGPRPARQPVGPRHPHALAQPPRQVPPDPPPPMYARAAGSRCSSDVCVPV